VDTKDLLDACVPHTCDDQLGNNADGPSCGARIDWLVYNEAMSVPAARVKVGTEYPEQCGLCAKPTAHKASHAATTHAATTLAATTLAATLASSPDATASLIALPANAPATTSAAVAGAPLGAPLVASVLVLAALMTVLAVNVIKMPQVAAEALESESGAHSASQPLTADDAADDAQPGSATTPYVPL
jgi:hypothetical protein